MRKIRVVIAKPGLDGHDRGAKVIARALRDAGHGGHLHRPAPDARADRGAALQEDADVIGLSILSGAHNHICPRVVQLLKEKGLDDVLVVLGGIIPDVRPAEAEGDRASRGVFRPGTPMQEIVDFIGSNARPRAEPSRRDGSLTRRPAGPITLVSARRPDPYSLSGTFGSRSLAEQIVQAMPYKLLLADDSVTIQRVIELTFADEDVQVIAVGDGQQAIERIEAERPDIVLADVGMPERDGYEVAAFVKSNPHLAHIPVLLLTGAFEPVDEQRARRRRVRRRAGEAVRAAMVITRVKELLAGGAARGPARGHAGRASRWRPRARRRRSTERGR